MNPLPTNSKELPGETLYLIALGVCLTQMALHGKLLTDNDVWWHLRAGQWIVEHGTVPQTDPFAWHGAAQAWVAYSWLFEVALYRLHQWLGLPGLALYVGALTLAILFALHWHLRRFLPAGGRAWLYSAVAFLPCLQMLMPRPWLLTVLFFILEAAWIAAARQGPEAVRWWALPLLFALWANVHIQFVYGLFYLGFAAAEPWLEQVLRGDLAWASWRANWRGRWWLLFAACCLATLATPYHVKLYAPLLEIARQAEVYRLINELQAPDFGSLATWAAVGLTGWAVFRLAWTRAPQRAPWLLLLLVAAISFRTRRDLWFSAIVAASMAAAVAPQREAEPRATPGKLAYALAAALSWLLVWPVAQARQCSAAALQQAAAERFPAAAARVIEARGYGGPLFNHLNWGGYLIWRLPQLPVSIDGRTNLYGAEGIERNFKTWNGARGWADDPALTAARLIVGDVTLPLCELLRHDARFTLVYEDEVAAVFIAR